MEARTSFTEECYDTVQDNKEQASSENLVHGKAAAGLAIHGDGGEEQEPIGNVKAVQDDGHQEKVSYQCKTCDRSFSQADNMKTHMLIKHLESEVFCCNACGTMFKTSEG